MLINKIKNRIKKEIFLITNLSILINPLYIIRSGLYKSIKKFSPEIKGDILDFGCGSKPYESLFTMAETYLGLDIEHSGHDHKNSKVDVFYNGQILPFENNQFDAVISFEVFEHLFNIDEILTEIKRVLKPNGKLLISIPFAWDEHEVPYDFARYTSYGISSILKKNGFEVIELEKTTTYILAIFQMFIAYLTQHLMPKNKLIKRIFQIALICPLNLLAILLNYILPKRYEYFCNIVILSKKLPITNSSPQL